MYHSWVMDGRMRRLILKDVLKEKSRYAGGRHIYIYMRRSTGWRSHRCGSTPNDWHEQRNSFKSVNNPLLGRIAPRELVMKQAAIEC